jgi:hypothetical protein
VECLVAGGGRVGIDWVEFDLIAWAWLKSVIRSALALAGLSPSAV